MTVGNSAWIAPEKEQTQFLLARHNNTISPWIPPPPMDAPLPPPSRGQTLSPASTTGSEWSGINGYSSMPRMRSPYSLDQSQSISPDPSPMNGTSDSPAGMPTGPPDGPRRPSFPASQAPSRPGSIANSRSSDGTLSDQQSRKYRRMEDQLAQHYDVLKRYLDGGQPQPPRPNKARDKLLRLSATQFHELSTDVYDELIRRQAATPPRPPPGRPPQRPPNVPPYLLPRAEFHEKRNQARQKLSSLQPQRFRDLATDVFCELERRFPHFANMTMKMGRKGSPSPSISGGFPSRGPMPPGFRPAPGGPNTFGLPPRGPPGRGPGPGPGGFGINGQRYPPRQGSLSSPPPGAESMHENDVQRPESDYGKPMPKQFQSNTITPNKSTMVEDEEDEFAVYDEPEENNRQSEAFGLDGHTGMGMQSRRNTSATNRSFSSSAAVNTKQLIEAQAKIQELQSRIEELEINLSLKDEEIGRLQDVEQSRSTESDWIDVKQDLEKRLEDAETLNNTMKDELDRLHMDQANVERDLRSQLDKAKRSQSGDSGWKTKYEQLERGHETLQVKLREQQHVTEEVRQQASGFLQEMRTMAESGGSNFEREEKLASDIRRLEEEVREWKGRYAKSKAQFRNLRASSIGLSMSRPDAARYAKANEFTQPDGLVKDIHVTKFQISIDELLRIARMEEPSSVLDHMKSVVVAVRSITQDIDAAGTGDKEDEQVRRRARLKSKVSATANNVITASKNFAASNGISPVSLLDAAASHLTMAVVELVRTVKIRPTPPGELDDEDEAAANMEPMKSPAYFNVESGHMRNTSANESVYSAVSTPAESAAGSSGANTAAHLRSVSKTSSDSTTATGYGNGPGPASVKPGFGMRAQDDGELEDLKLYLEDQTDSLVRSIQSLVGSVRAEAALVQIRTHISTIADVVGQVVSATESSLSPSSALRGRVEPIIQNLANCKSRLTSASAESEALSEKGRVREFMSSLPPLAFEIARETKELVQRVEMADQGEGDGGQEDYS